MKSLSVRRSSRVTFKRKSSYLWSDWFAAVSISKSTNISMPLHGVATDQQGMIGSSKKCLADSEISARKGTSPALIKNADERRECAKRRATMALIQASREQRRSLRHWIGIALNDHE